MPSKGHPTQHVSPGRVRGNSQRLSSYQPLCETLQTRAFRMSRSGAPIYEHEIQRIWAEQDFDSSGLKTVDGKKIEVFSPGWWNQGQGPDFEAARLSIGDDFFYGFNGDWETRRIFTSFEYKKVNTPNTTYSVKFIQAGIAPYLGEYGDLHTWLMVKLKKNSLSDSWSAFPFLQHLFRSLTSFL